MLYAPYSNNLLHYMEQPNVILVLAAQIEFNSGTTRVHSGTGTIVINGQAFFGVGILGDVGSVKEQNNTSSSQMSLTLSGLDTALIAETLNEQVIGRNVTCYIAAVNPETGIVDAADLLFRGFITESTLLAGKSNGVNYVVSNIFEKWSNGLTDRYTDENQIAKRSGDRFFRYIAQMSERSIYWGSSKDAPRFIYK